MKSLAVMMPHCWISDSGGPECRALDTAMVAGADCRSSEDSAKEDRPFAFSRPAQALCHGGLETCTGLDACIDVITNVDLAKLQWRSDRGNVARKSGRQWQQWFV